MKEHNIFTLNTKKDKPTFQNEKAKFWLLYETKKYSVFLAKANDGEKDFLVIDRTTGDPVYSNKNLESACFHADLLEKIGEKK